MKKETKMHQMSHILMKVMLFCEETKLLTISILKLFNLCAFTVGVYYCIFLNHIETGCTPEIAFSVYFIYSQDIIAYNLIGM